MEVSVQTSFIGEKLVLDLFVTRYRPWSATSIRLDLCRPGCLCQTGSPAWTCVRTQSRWQLRFEAGPTSLAPATGRSVGCEFS